MTLRKGDELSGKVALVTGAGRNIGRAIARSLAAGGASVMVNANSSREAAQETVALIEKDGGHAACYIASVTDEGAVNAMVDETVRRFGRLDILVNNHTLRDQTAFQDMTYEKWREVVLVILDGVFLTSRAAVPHMIEAGGGAIVNLGGQHGYSGGRSGSHVGAGKMGVLGMTRGMAHDLAPHRITVNCVVPGLINTLMESGELAHARATPPIGRLGTMEEVAAMVRHLAGPDGSYITGQAIHMNGGGYMG
jgi:3-oxoacyl-[acyl-carrier protein] reductase